MKLKKIFSMSMKKLTKFLAKTLLIKRKSAQSFKTNKKSWMS